MATSGDLIRTTADILGMSPVLVGSYWRYLREAGLTTKGGRGKSAPRVTSRDAALLLVACGGAGIERRNAADVAREYGEMIAADTARKLEVHYKGRIEITMDSLGDSQTAKKRREEIRWQSDGWAGDGNGRWHFEGMSVPTIQALPDRHGLTDAIAALIDSGGAHEIDRVRHKQYPDIRTYHSIDVVFRGPVPLAVISVRITGGNEFDYEEQATYCLSDQLALEAGGGAEDDFQQFRAKHGEADLEIRRSFTHETIYTIADLIKE